MADLPTALLVGKERIPRSARLVRALVREGLVPRPEFPEYSLALARGLDTARGHRDEDLGPSVLDALRADAGLIEHELWEILRTEGAGKDLASSDAWEVTPHRHNVTYGRGLVPRAPRRAVTLARRARRPTLLKAGQLNHDTFLAAAPAAVVRSDKGPAIKTLKLIGDLVKARPSVADQAAAVVIEALAPSLRASPRPTGASDDLSPPLPDPERDRLLPVKDPDELAELFARLVEEADDPAEVERLLDGAARLARQHPRRGADALIRRLRELTGAYYPGAWSGDDLRADLVAVGLTWLDGVPAGEGYLGRHYQTEYRDITGGFTSADPSRSMPVWRCSGCRLTSSISCAYPRRTARAGRSASSWPCWWDHRPAWERVIGESIGLYRTDRYERAVSWRDRDAPAGDADSRCRRCSTEATPCGAWRWKRRTGVRQPLRAGDGDVAAAAAAPP